MKTVRRSSAFTLIELLVVIAILGILTALTVPALKNIGKSNIQTSASRQLLDGLGRARQLAINNRTTVYMVFVPTNFCNTAFLTGLTTMTVAADRSVALATATNLVASQLTGYNFISHGKLGDQPGQHQWRYLDSWNKLPDGNMIEAQKFLPLSFLPIPQWQADYNRPATAITNFALTTQIPFPTENSPTNGSVFLPYVAFNYLGQLTVDGSTLSTRDEYIPLAQGAVDYPLDSATKLPILSTTPLTASAITENPPGNSTNISYNVIHVDALTGRAVLEFFKIK